MAVAAADTASQKAAEAAGHEAVSLDAATRAENSALSMVGAQPADATLTALANQVTAADRLPLFYRCRYRSFNSAYSLRPHPAG